MRNALQSQSNDIEVDRATRWLFASAAVVFLCGILAIVLPLAFSVGVAGFLGWLFIFAAVVIFGIHFRIGTFAWHALIAALYALAAISLLANPLLGVVLLALMIGVVLIGEGIIEIVLFFALRDYRHAIWILIDGVVTLSSVLWHARTGRPAVSSLFTIWWGSASFRAAFPDYCSGSQFASRRQQERGSHEEKLNRASEPASREQTAVTLNDLGSA